MPGKRDVDGRWWGLASESLGEVLCDHTVCLVMYACPEVGAGYLTEGQSFILR